MIVAAGGFQAEPGRSFVARVVYLPVCLLSRQSGTALTLGRLWLARLATCDRCLRELDRFRRLD